MRHGSDDERRQLAAAARAYRVSHWGIGSAGILTRQCADPSLSLAGLGELVSLVYRTRKLGDGGVADYEHEFSRARPLLCFEPESKLLVIAGGSYRVLARGITG